MAEEVGVRQPDDGQAAADDARPRPPEDAAPAAVHGLVAGDCRRSVDRTAGTGDKRTLGTPTGTGVLFSPGPSPCVGPRAARDSRRSALTLAHPVTTHNNIMRPAVAIFMLTTATASATFCCGHSGTAWPATSHVLLQEKSRSRTSVTPTSCDSAPASRSRVTAMVHTTDELQLAAAVVLPLLAYKVAAIVQRNQLQWYLDASIALATASLLVYAAS